MDFTCVWLVMLSAAAAVPPPVPRPPAEDPIPAEWRELDGELAILPVQDSSRLVDVSKYRNGTPHLQLRSVPAR